MRPSQVHDREQTQGTLICGGLLAGAFVARAQQRIQTYGFSRSLKANAADAIATTFMAIPIAGVTIEFGASLPRSYRLIVNGAATIPDVAGFVGGFRPVHDRVFFNGYTRSW
jgi:hypothetical protein